MYNETLLSPLQLLHNEYSEWRLLYLYMAEAEQVVTMDASKNRRLAFSATESGRFVSSALEFSPRFLQLDTLSDDRFNLLRYISPSTQLASFMEHIQQRLMMFTGFTRKGNATIMINSFQNRHNLLEQTSFKSNTDHDKRIKPTTPSEKRK